MKLPSAPSDCHCQWQWNYHGALVPLAKFFFLADIQENERRSDVASAIGVRAIEAISWSQAQAASLRSVVLGCVTARDTVTWKAVLKITGSFNPKAHDRFPAAFESTAMIVLGGNPI